MGFVMAAVVLLGEQQLVREDGGEELGAVVVESTLPDVMF